MPNPAPIPRPPLRPARELAAELRNRADDFVAGPLDPDADAQPQSRQGRRLFWWEGLTSNVSESFVTNFVNPFALALGATNTQIGWLSSLSNLGAALALFPGARLVERTGHRKWIALLSGGVAGRLLLLAIALSPLLFHGQGAIYAFIALVALRAFLGQLGYPAWSALVADLVPASDSRALLLVAEHCPGGRRADLHPAGRSAGGCLRGAARLSGQLLVAGLIGFVATVIFGRIPRAAPGASGQGGDGAKGRHLGHPD